MKRRRRELRVRRPSHSSARLKETTLHLVRFPRKPPHNLGLSGVSTFDTPPLVFAYLLHQEPQETHPFQCQSCPVH